MSKTRLFGLPVLPVSFKYRPNYLPAVGSIGIAHSLIAQTGLYLGQGYGQIVKPLR